MSSSDDNSFREWLNEAFSTFVDMDVFNTQDPSVIDELNQWVGAVAGLLNIPMSPEVNETCWNVYSTVSYNMVGPKMIDGATWHSIPGTDPVIGTNLPEDYWNFQINQMQSSGLGARISSAQKTNFNDLVSVSMDSNSEFKGMDLDASPLELPDGKDSSDGTIYTGIYQTFYLNYGVYWNEEDKHYTDYQQVKFFVYIKYKPHTTDPYRVDIYVQELHENKGNITPVIQMADVYVGIQRKETYELNDVQYDTKNVAVNAAKNWSDATGSVQHVTGTNADSQQVTFQNWAKLRVRRQIGQPSDLVNGDTKAVKDLKDNYISHKFNMYQIYHGEIPYNHDGSGEFNAHVDISAQMGLYTYLLESEIDWTVPGDTAPIA